MVALIHPVGRPATCLLCTALVAMITNMAHVAVQRVRKRGVTGSMVTKSWNNECDNFFLLEYWNTVLQYSVSVFPVRSSFGVQVTGMDVQFDLQVL